MTYLSYRVTGDGIPLVLLHAMPLDSTIFESVRSHIDTVITVDGPGFGTSPEATEIDAVLGMTEPSLDTYAKAVISDLAELGVERCALGGLSMGGAVAMSILHHAPHLVTGLVLMDTNIGADTEETRQKRLEAATAADGGDISSVFPMATTMTSSVTQEQRPDVMADLHARLRGVRPQSLAWIQRAMATRLDRRHLIEDLTIPLLLIRGEDDASCTESMLDDLAQRYPGSATIHTIRGAGHFTALETPSELGHVLNEFTARL